MWARFLDISNRKKWSSHFQITIVVLEVSLCNLLMVCSFGDFLTFLLGLDLEITEACDNNLRLA